MIFLACVLLIITFCSAETEQSKEEAVLKRALEHRSNLALLTSIHLGDDKTLNALSPDPYSIVSRPNDGVNSQPKTNLELYNSENVQAPPAARTNLELTYNSENVQAPPTAQAFTNDLPLTYTPAHRFALVNNPVNFEGTIPVYPGNNLFQYTYGNIAPLYTNNLASNNLIQPQEAVPPQQYQFQVTKEVPVPQPYPVSFIRTVMVPVHIKVPVEVPKPYEVRVPHPVPVPVHIKVPVPVEKPYPVQITKTVAVPVEKPVYIKVPQPIEVPVAQPYPVAVPQPVQIKVPVVARISEGGNLNGLTNLDGTPYVPSAPVAVQSTSPGPVDVDVQNTTGPSPDNALTGEVVSSTEAAVTVRPSLSPFTGNGLLPPLPPTTRVTPLERVIGGLLSSYVASKEGGVYRRNTTKYQTVEYQKTW